MAAPYRIAEGGQGRQATYHTVSKSRWARGRMEKSSSEDQTSLSEYACNSPDSVNFDRGVFKKNVSWPLILAHSFTGTWTTLPGRAAQEVVD